VSLFLRFSPIPLGSCATTSDALAILPEIKVCVLFGEFVSMLAVCLAKVWTHGQSFVEHAALRIKQFLQCVALFGSGNNRVSFHASNLSKQNGFICDSFNRNLHGVASVKHLLFVGRPSAIFRFIVACVFDSFKGKSLWSMPHVLKESDKALLPSLADNYAPSPVVCVSRAFRVQAALFHGYPATVGGAFA